MRKVAVLSFFIAVCICLVSQAENANSPGFVQTLKLSDFVCSGDFESLVREGKKVSSEDNLYVLTKLTLLSAPSELASTLEKGSVGKVIVKELSDIDRLIFASALMRSNSIDHLRMMELLSFHSSNSIIEAYRKYHVAKLEYNISPTQSFDKVIQAFYDLPYLDASLLHQIFLLGLRDKHPELVLKQFFPYIDQLPEKSAAHYLLQADKDFLLSRVNRNEIDISAIQAAYGLCKYDMDVAIFYASLLVNKKMNDEAERVLLALVEKYPKYPVYVDLTLAKIFFIKNDLKNGKKYFDRANQKKELLEKDNQKELEGLSVATRNRDSYLIWILAGAAFLVGCAFLIYRKLKIKKYI
ncbi:hypothetical protein [Bdellovibrio svalbardensis]|uniref:Uncharacterized protein n=1 Tax=Bdellovibrio svalbardensis TaxID=2972972 RepID=A0ABT6DIA5_9BACT|nr:hypothetical protein [Bdellovibrio svalbardensis]MDG0816249.1 hypothetical protein [Bdellovibrio svalbardensis]